MPPRGSGVCRGPQAARLDLGYRDVIMAFVLLTMERAAGFGRFVAAHHMISGQASARHGDRRRGTVDGAANPDGEGSIDPAPAVQDLRWRPSRPRCGWSEELGTPQRSSPGRSQASRMPLRRTKIETAGHLSRPTRDGPTPGPQSKGTLRTHISSASSKKHPPGRARPAGGVSATNGGRVRPREQRSGPPRTSR